MSERVFGCPNSFSQPWTTDIWTLILYCGGLTFHYRMVNSILGLYSLDASSTTAPQTVKIKYLQTLSQIPCMAKLSLVEN